MKELLLTKGQRRRKYDVEQVAEAAKTSFSIRETMIKLGLSATGGGYYVIKKFIANNNIDISHFSGKMWSKGKVIGPRRPIEDYLENRASINSHKLKQKLIAAGIFEHRCYRCGLSEWLGEKIPLELEHINGDHYDNTLSNLTLLCPNCHSFTPTYRGKKLKIIREEKEIKSKKEKVKKPRPRKFEVSKEELSRLVWEMPTTKVAEMYGVSDNAIAKRCKILGIEQPPRGYWKRNTTRKRTRFSRIYAAVVERFTQFAQNESGLVTPCRFESCLRHQRVNVFQGTCFSFSPFLATGAKDKTGPNYQGPKAYG